jgi:hypothetical protein
MKAGSGEALNNAAVRAGIVVDGEVGRLGQILIKILHTEGIFSLC